MDTYFKALKQIPEEKDEITFLSGAGLSTSAGLPDFRSDEDGFWKSNSPVHFKDFLSSKEYRKKSWQNNIAIHEKLNNVKPTKMHNLVQKVIQRNETNFHITQNIDGLHRDKAQENNIIELHGNIFKANCLKCQAEYETLEYFDNLELNSDCICSSCSEGFVKVIVGEKYGEILGAHIIGSDATELITEYGLAMNMEATVDEIHGTIHAHPTMSEALAEAAAAAHGEAIHI